jgi:hypothetical protein
MKPITIINTRLRKFLRKMTFQIRKVGSAAVRICGIKDLLGLLGDKVNDEVRIDDESYRISSAVEAAGQGGGVVTPAPMILPVVDWIREPIQVAQSGQTIFPIAVPIDDPEGLLLVVNGAMYDYGADGAFHIEGEVLIWHGSFSLEPTDRVYLKYLTLKHQL